MPDPLRLRGGVVVDASELVWRFSRSSGPGGQGVNTTDSRVELLLDVGSSPSLAPYRDRVLSRLAGRLSDNVLVVTASEHRSQLRNRDEARRRMEQLLSEAIAPPPRTRRPTRPTRSSVNRRLAGKRRRSELKRLRRPGADDS
jgi:ribosome-associated protein